MPQSSSKWKDLNKDVALAQGTQPLLPPLQVEIVSVSVDKPSVLKANPPLNGNQNAGESRYKLARATARREGEMIKPRRKD